MSADLQVCCSSCTATAASRHTLHYGLQLNNVILKDMLFACGMFAASAPVVQMQWCSCCRRVVDYDE